MWWGVQYIKYNLTGDFIAFKVLHGWVLVLTIFNWFLTNFFVCRSRQYAFWYVSHASKWIRIFVKGLTFVLVYIGSHFILQIGFQAPYRTR